MKRVFTIIFISLAAITTYSAKAQVKSYIALYGGISNPLGDYSATDYNNNKAGFAKKGVTFGIDGAVYLYKNLGIGATISFQDQGKLTYDETYALAQGYTTAFEADQSTVTATGRYHNWNVLLGPQYSFTYHSFILDLRASAGIIKLNSTPEIAVSEVGVPTQTAPFYQRKSSAYLLGYGGNVGLRFKLSDDWSIGLKGAYIKSDGPTVKNDGRTDDRGRIVTKLPITEFQTTLGITLQF